MRCNMRRGFSLIELLVVIAIIAILAALLFPVFNRARESARQGTCISNMHEIYVKAGLYRDDHNGQYPNMLLGYAERVDGNPYTAADGTPASASAIKKGFLFPTYVKSIEAFHCPDNADNDLKKVVSAAYPPSSPWSSAIPGGAPTFSAGGIMPPVPDAFKTAPIGFYAYDSYDITAAMGSDGRRINAADGQPGFFVAYSRDWSAAKFLGKDPKQDAPNQLQYTNPPLDRTVLMMCNYHATTGGGNMCPVMLASGTAKPLAFADVLHYGWNITNH